MFLRLGPLVRQRPQETKVEKQKATDALGAAKKKQKGAVGGASVAASSASADGAGKINFEKVDQTRGNRDV